MNSKFHNKFYNKQSKPNTPKAKFKRLKIRKMTQATDMMSPTPIFSTRDELSVCATGAWAWVLLAILCLLGFVLLIWLLHKFIQGPDYSKKNRINGKVVIVTGCNTGIGKETAMELAQRGARVYMACRDWARCEASRQEIIAQTNNQNVFNRTLDLGSLDSVRKFAAEFLAEESRLDILVNNGGVFGLPHTLTVDGYEYTFAVNHLGHFLLTNLLLDCLKNSAPSRVVVVSSMLYAWGSIKKDDLNSLKKYSKWGAYAQSKLANVLFTKKLAHMLKGTGVTVNCCHPGGVRTEIGRSIEMDGCAKDCMNCCSYFLLKSPRKGAQTSLKLALDPKLEKSSGGYYSDGMRLPLVPWVGNQKLIDWLWQESEHMVGLNSKHDNAENNV